MATRVSGTRAGVNGATRTTMTSPGITASGKISGSSNG
jgi:hypothetical protein